MADPSSQPSNWGFPTGFFTSAYLFLFLNIVIGTIALISRFGSNRRPHQEEIPPPLARLPSLLQRVKSINLPFYNYPSPDLSPQVEPTLYDTEPEYTTEVQSAQLQRVPSFLERVKSIKLPSLHRSQQETVLVTEHDSNPHVDTGHASSMKVDHQVKRSKSDYPSPDSSPQVEPTLLDTEPEYTTEVQSAQLQRVPSFLERVKSIKLPSLHRSQQETVLVTEHDSNPHVDTGHASSMKVDHQVKRSKSEPRVVPEMKAPEKMKKSASEREVAVEENRESVERRRPATTRIEKTTSFGDEGVDAKADDFINRFKQQLKLQRLDSLLRYRDMLKRN